MGFFPPPVLKLRGKKCVLDSSKYGKCSSLELDPCKQISAATQNSTDFISVSYTYNMLMTGPGAKSIKFNNREKMRCVIIDADSVGALGLKPPPKKVIKCLAPKSHIQWAELK